MAVDEARAAVELAGRILRAEGIDDGELGLAFVGADEMRGSSASISGSTRRPTSSRSRSTAATRCRQGSPRALGDVVLCPEVVGDEWRWPLAHGLLHLLGYDHGDEMARASRSCSASSQVTARRVPTILDSFNYAFEGIIHVLRTQRNLRIHFAIAVAVLVLALIVDVTKIELIALLLSITFVLIAEMLNTAIEAAIDIATTSFDPMAKLAKDIAAGAVLIAAVNALAVGYLVFSGKVADRSATLLDRLRHAPAELTLVALVLTIIVVIATKAYTGRGTPLRGGLPSGHAALAFAGWMAATYAAGSEPPLPRLVDRADHGAPRRADPRRVGRPLGARGHATARSSARSPRSSSSRCSREATWSRRRTRRRRVRTRRTRSTSSARSCARPTAASSRA